MLENGRYSAWFRTPLGEGTGVVLLKDGAITGGDTVLEYTGSYNQDGDVFTADDQSAYAGAIIGIRYR